MPLGPPIRASMPPIHARERRSHPASVPVDLVPSVPERSEDLRDGSEQARLLLAINMYEARKHRDASKVPLTFVKSLDDGGQLLVHRAQQHLPAADDRLQSLARATEVAARVQHGAVPAYPRALYAWCTAVAAAQEPWAECSTAAVRGIARQQGHRDVEAALCHAGCHDAVEGTVRWKNVRNAARSRLATARLVALSSREQ
mmetsp:Transcript_76439/g.196867  ORF Transcript_76439/g.196867 Transcript_76439/m.196867 type:complete len:201 (-) Transcript_76439:172-774(-)